MAKQREETYCDMPSDTLPHCVVTGCPAPVVVEVHTDDYAAALALFRGTRRAKIHARRSGDERFYVCNEHLEHDGRMAGLRWQGLMFPA